ncbi:hypothetical protein F5B22DRAFT_640920 [Xylaria bambusicola]|uniref:uncharacterized protein n=1 Tax=Xylaria bambusicola TaxID=326684 RepID=UPI002007F0D1|nr:uncharacterized protein F5B22DRAFT_640920 [Xylaria bambusicola]KAI0527944.1 hypothetical protein F5B22DRAFT_640920 [Xylaria bambusicola]
MSLRVVAESHFVSPRTGPPNGHGPYGSNARWQLGSSQLVAFQTNWTAYKIELWQQPLQSTAIKAANIVYNQNVGQDLPQSFYWTVQTYNLLLADSALFFFSLQDSNSPARKPSPFFNITIATAPVSSKTTTSSETTQSFSNQPTSSTSSVSTVSTQASLPASSPSEHMDMTQGVSGVSAGTAAGIGVGVASGIVLVAILIWVALRRRRRDQQQQQQQQPAEIEGRELVTRKRGSLEKRPITEYDQPRLELPG